MPVRTRSFVCTALVLGALAPARAQWSTDPAQNLAVADASSDQNLAKLAPTTDGGAWVAWFDGLANGYDVRLQRLEASGVERFAHNGLLVADRNFTSTQDHGLDLASDGSALLAFRDTRPGGTQITAARISAAGAHVWGASGAVLTNTTTFVASPKVAGTADGHAVVAWTEGSTVRLQRLDAAGVPQWGSGVVLTPAAGSYTLSDVHDVGDEVIVAFVHQTGGFLSPRHIRAQRFDASGAPLWGAGSVAVFDGGSLQIGNFPTFRVDASGNSLFAWYTSSPTLQCYVQRLDPVGSELFPHNGVAVATTGGRVRVNPDAVVDPATSDVYVAWREQGPLQSPQGVYAQRLDPAGNRLWSNDGLVLSPLGTATEDLVRIVADSQVGGGGALVFWSTAPTFGTDVLVGAHVTAAGVVDVPRFDVASTPSQKMRLVAEKSRVGVGSALLVWTDARADAGDLFAQNVAFDGALGVVPGLGTNYCGPATANSSGAAARISASGSPVVADGDLTLRAEDLARHAASYFLASRTQGFVTQPGGSQGNLCLGGAIGRRVGGVVVGSGATGVVSVVADLAAMPQPAGAVAVVAGETWSFQCWFRDSVGGTATSNFTDGLAIPFQ